LKSYNVHLTYRFGLENKYLKNTDIRLGANNVLNAKPPLFADFRGYDVSVYNTMARGRIYSLQITKKL
jgi:outer membrane receptor protein involved in Fe transport